MARFGWLACVVLFLVCNFTPLSATSNHVKKTLAAAKLGKQLKMRYRVPEQTEFLQTTEGLLTGKSDSEDENDSQPLPVNWVEAMKTLDEEINSKESKYQDSLKRTELDELQTIVSDYMDNKENDTEFIDQTLPSMVEAQLSELEYSFADSTVGKEKLAKFIHNEYDFSLDLALKTVSDVMEEVRPAADPALTELSDSILPGLLYKLQYDRFASSAEEKLRIKFNDTYASKRECSEAMHSAVEAQQEESTGLLAVIRNVTRLTFLESVKESEQEEGVAKMIQDGAKLYKDVLVKALDKLESSEGNTSVDDDIPTFLQHGLAQTLDQPLDHDGMIKLIKLDTDKIMERFFPLSLEQFRNDNIPIFVGNVIKVEITHNLLDLISSTAVNVASKHHGKEEVDDNSKTQTKDQGEGGKDENQGKADEGNTTEEYGAEKTDNDAMGGSPTETGTDNTEKADNTATKSDSGSSRTKDQHEGGEGENQGKAASADKVNTNGEDGTEKTDDDAMGGSPTETGTDNTEKSPVDMGGSSPESGAEKND